MPPKKQRGAPVGDQSQEEQTEMFRGNYCTLCDTKFVYRTERDKERHRATKMHANNCRAKEAEKKLTNLIQESAVLNDQYGIRPRIRDVHLCVFNDINNDDILGEKAVHRVVRELRLHQSLNTSVGTLSEGSEIEAATVSASRSEDSAKGEEGGEAKSATGDQGTQGEGVPGSRSHGKNAEGKIGPEDRGTGKTSAVEEHTTDTSQAETSGQATSQAETSGQDTSQAETGGQREIAPKTTEAGQTHIYAPSEHSQLKERFDSLHEALEKVKVNEITILVLQMMMKVAVQMMDEGHALDFFPDIFPDLCKDHLETMPQGYELAKNLCQRQPSKVIEAMLKAEEEEVSAEADVSAEAEVSAEVSAEADVSAEAEVSAEAKASAKVEAGGEAGTKAEAGVETGAEAGVEAGAEAGAEATVEAMASVES